MWDSFELEFVDSQTGCSLVGIEVFVAEVGIELVVVVVESLEFGIEVDIEQVVEKWVEMEFVVGL